MKAASIGLVLASIHRVYAEIMLVDDVGLKNSLGGARMLSDVAQRLRRGYGDNVSVVGGAPSRGYVTRDSHIEKYVPVSGMLRRLGPAVHSPRPVSRAAPRSPVVAPHPRSPRLSGMPSSPVMPSIPSIPRPSLGPVYSPILNPKMPVKSVEARPASSRPATKSRPKAHRTTTPLPVEHPRGGDSSDYGVEIDMPEKTSSQADTPPRKGAEPASDDLDVFPLSDDAGPTKDPSVKIDSPVKIDVPESREESAPEDVMKAARQISSILIPRMRRRKYAKRHNSNIQSAGKARQTYLDYKLIESQENLKSIEKKLEALRRLYMKISAKLKTLRDERDQARSRILSARSALENSENAAKSLQEEIARNEGQIKLEEIEVSKLERAISEERNKLSILADQQKIYQSRLEAFGGKEGARKEELKSSENQLKDYDRLLEQIQKDAENLQSRITEMETKRRLEIDTQNRLEIEKKEVEDSSHLPLFALYD